MKKQNLLYYLFNKKIALRIIVVNVICIMFSCNKGVNNLLLNKEDNIDTSNISDDKTRVLYIMVDGLRGQAIKDLFPSNLSQIAKNSIYTYNSLDNTSGVDASNWSDMLTGVDTAKHMVKSEDFANNDLKDYPSIFTRLKSLEPTIRTAAFSRSTILDENLLADASVHQVFSSDNEVITSGLEEINNNNPSLVLMQLHAVDSAGKASSYQSSDAVYANAISDFDNELGVIIDNLRSRPDFINENWMVVIASGKGGELPYNGTDDTTYYNNPRGNGFVYFYNPKFATNFYIKPSTVSYEGATPIYTGSSFGAYAPSATTTDYDINASSEMTISFKLKVLQFGSLNPGIILKTGSSANSYNGWWFCHNGSNGSIRFVVHGTGGTNASKNNTLTTTAGYHKVNEWHSYTGKVYFGTDGKRYMELYADGVAVTSSSPIDITGLNASAINSSTNYPLEIGIPGSYSSGTTKEMITDLQIFNVALPDAIIAKYACKPQIDSSHPYYNNLIGYWKCLDATGSALVDISNKKNSMSFKNAPSAIWNSFNESSNYICPEITNDYLTVNPKGIDIPYQIYTWLGFKIQNDWNLDGKYWTTQYTIN